MFKSRTHYINYFRNLINLEREEDIKRHKEEIERLSGAKREKKGRAILGMRGKKIGSLYGQGTLIKYSKEKGHVLENLDMQAGDALLISRGHPLKKGTPIGTLVEKGKYHLLVSVAARPEKWMLKSGVRIDLYVNDVTYRRMQEALDTLMYGREVSRRLISWLIGEKDKYYKPAAKSPVQGASFMNSSQKNAVAQALSEPDFHIVHGPPGTGKTRTGAQIIGEVVGRGGRVLATAQSNGAVDNLAQRLVDTGLNCVRIGRPFKIESGLKAITLDKQVEKDKRFDEVTKLREQAFEKIKEQSVYTPPSPRWTRGMKNRDIHRLAARGKGSRGVSAQQMKSISAWIKIRESADILFEKADQLEMEIIQSILKGADVVLATNAGAGISLLEGHVFDYVVIDEATQSTESSALIPAVKGKHLILIGDHKQLPPTVISRVAQDKGFSISLQERLIDRYGPQSTSLLNIQYRMNDLIMQFSNAQFYEGKLTSANENKSWRLDIPQLPGSFTKDPWLMCATGHSAVFCDVRGEEAMRGEGPSYENKDEASCLVQMVTFLKARGIELGQIGIISPYKAQVYLLKEMLRESVLYNEREQGEKTSIQENFLQVDTVDGFQGREKDVILISLVRTGEKGIGFLQDTRRLNVALTRAKKLRITFGNAKGLSKYPVYDTFIDQSVCCRTYKK